MWSTIMNTNVIARQIYENYFFCWCAAWSDAYFYITQHSKEEFITKIILPLLKMVNTGKDYTWVCLTDKDGFWRELEDNETTVINGEVSLNVETNKNMVKLS